MRFVVLTMTAAVLACACGCGSTEKKKAAPPAKKTAPAQTLSGAPSPEHPILRPVSNILSGRIIAVRDPLRFVVVDFANHKMPQIEQRLSVYRLDQKVAEIKISGPYLGTTVAADIVAGDPREGDVVKSE